MNTTHVLLGLATILAAATLIYSFAPAGSATVATTAQHEPVLEPITLGQATATSVELTLAPRVSGDELVVSYRANTHGGSLADHDMMAAYLETAQGRSPPISADQMSGHHASGTMVFDRPEGTFTIVIEGLAGMAERRYEWSS